MGSDDSTEICQLVGIYILKSLENLIEKQHVGLHCDNGLLVLRNTNVKKTRRNQKKLKDI